MPQKKKVRDYIPAVTDSVVYVFWLEHCLNLIVDVLGCESKFFIKNFVRCGESEALKAEHLAVASYETSQIYRKTCCKTENLGSLRKNALLILLALVAEQTL